MVDGSAEFKSKGVEEAALNRIRAFQSDSLKAFVHAELQLPTAMHKGLGSLRMMLQARTSQFMQLPDLCTQLDYLLEAYGQSTACPQAWVAYASSVSCLLASTGTFPDTTQEVFLSEGNLGCVCAMRARYMTLAMRDLWSLRVLKIPSHSPKLLQDMTNAMDCPEISGDGMLTASQDFAAALAGFDSVAWQNALASERTGMKLYGLLVFLGRDSGRTAVQPCS